MEKIFIYRQLGVMLRSGVHVVKALEAVANCCKCKDEQKIWLEVSREVCRGSTLTQAWSLHPGYFDLIEVGLIQAGEASCALDEICLDISKFFSLELELKRKLSSALQYPLTVCLGFAALSVLVILHIIPSFAPIFDSLARLPLPTLMLLGFVSLLQSKALWAISGIIIFVFLLALKTYRFSAYGQKKWQTFVLTVPLLGKIAKNIISARFCHTLALLLRSGLPLHSSLQITSLALANYPLASALEHTISGVHQGCEFSEALQMGKYFPKSFINAVHVAMEANSLDDVLERLSKFYNEQVNYDISKFSVLIEPILLCVMGLSTAGVLLALFAPLYEFINLSAVL
ncbi:TPA: hypothetical protein DD394_01070 [bacterium UBP9_UBA11836]|nr:hypothetical protein [bacterium UBP9_UBA11836]